MEGQDTLGGNLGGYLASEAKGGLGGSLGSEADAPFCRMKPRRVPRRKPRRVFVRAGGWVQWVGRVGELGTRVGRLCFCWIFFVNIYIYF